MREVSGHWIDEQLIRMFASGPSGTACRQSISPERINRSKEDGWVRSGVKTTRLWAQSSNSHYPEERHFSCPSSRHL